MTPFEKTRLEQAAILLLGLARQSTEVVGEPASKKERQRILIAAARRELAARRQRAEILQKLHMTGDAGWDILLELFIARANGAQLYVTALGLESAIPQTTVLRWLGVMEAENIVRRKQDPHDRRRYWIGLTSGGLDLVEKCIQSQLDLASDCEQEFGDANLAANDSVTSLRA